MAGNHRPGFGQVFVPHLPQLSREVGDAVGAFPEVLRRTDPHGCGQGLSSPHSAIHRA